MREEGRGRGRGREGGRDGEAGRREMEGGSQRFVEKRRVGRTVVYHTGEEGVEGMCDSGTLLSGKTQFLGAVLLFLGREVEVVQEHRDDDGQQRPGHDHDE